MANEFMVITPFEAILRWMQTNAPAAWISALVAIGLLVRSRKKPKKLVFREVINTSVVSIWPSVRDKVKMTFDGEPIERLGQIQGEIYNSGSDTIQNPAISLTLSEDSVVLGVLLTPQDFDTEKIISRNTVTITFPYLNSVRDHRQIVKVSLLVDGPTEVIAVKGGGEGWSVRHLSLPSKKAEAYRVLAGFIGLCLGMLGSFCVGFYTHTRARGILGSVAFRDMFLAALSALSIPTVLIIAVVIIGWRWLLRMFRELPR